MTEEPKGILINLRFWRLANQQKIQLQTKWTMTSEEQTVTSNSFSDATQELNQEAKGAARKKEMSQPAHHQKNTHFLLDMNLLG